jgi:hypothetical protein
MASKLRTLYQVAIVGIGSSLTLPFTGIFDEDYSVADIGGLDPNAIDNNPAVSVSNQVRDYACGRLNTILSSELFFCFLVIEEPGPYFIKEM